jgi:hypothetical protein
MTTPENPDPLLPFFDTLHFTSAERQNFLNGLDNAFAQIPEAMPKIIQLYPDIPQLLAEDLLDSLCSTQLGEQGLLTARLNGQSPQWLEQIIFKSALFNLAELIRKM